MRADQRCDGCNAQAYTRWERDSDMAELTFCNHCTNVNEVALRVAEFVMKIDDRHLLERSTREPEPA